MANQLVWFVVILVGVDLLARAAGPRAHAAYRRVVGRAYAAIRRQVISFLRWAWRSYRQFILGFLAGALATLYFTGHFQ